MTRIEFAAAAYLLSGYALFLLAMFAAAMYRASRQRRRDANSESLLPGIRDALVAYLTGNNDQTAIRTLAAAHRREVASAIMSFRNTLSGNARDRLCGLALDLALVHDWIQEAHSKDLPRRRAAYDQLAFVSVYEPCRRVAGDMLWHGLEHDDAEVRLLAARALVQSGDAGEVTQVFQFAVSQNLLTRILLTMDLRRHAAVLCERAIPAVLHSDDTRQVRAALQILTGWERGLALEDLHELLDHRDREIRVAALRLAPFVPLTPRNQSSILRELTDPDAEVSTVAALTAGRLRLQGALPSLARCVRTGTAELARIAANALADMPPRGWQTLEELAGGPNPAAAFIAAEALERTRRKAGH